MAKSDRPGDWVWMSSVTLVVAIVGAAVAIAVSGGSGSTGESTEVAPVPQASTKGTPTRQPAPNGRTQWPAGRTGWTTILVSYPVRGGTAGPDATAARAAAASLPEVGVLESGTYSSLHPGYYVVFSGIYSSYNEAAAALHTVHSSGFGSAYAREITR